jgi:hypothetical protein
MRVSQLPVQVDFFDYTLKQDAAMTALKIPVRILTVALCLSLPLFVVFAAGQEFEVAQDCRCATLQVLNIPQKQDLILEREKPAVLLTVAVIALSLVYPPSGLFVYGIFFLVAGLFGMTNKSADNVYYALLHYHGRIMLAIGLVLMVVAGILVWVWQRLSPAPNPAAG